MSKSIQIYMQNSRPIAKAIIDILKKEGEISLGELKKRLPEKYSRQIIHYNINSLLKNGDIIIYHSELTVKCDSRIVRLADEESSRIRKLMMSLQSDEKEKGNFFSSEEKLMEVWFSRVIDTAKKFRDWVDMSFTDDIPLIFLFFFLINWEATGERLIHAIAMDIVKKEDLPELIKLLSIPPSAVPKQRYKYIGDIPAEASLPPREFDYLWLLKEHLRKIEEKLKERETAVRLVEEVADDSVYD